jgi:hypothetical protein
MGPSQSVEQPPFPDVATDGVYSVRVLNGSQHYASMVGGFMFAHT